MDTLASKISLQTVDKIVSALNLKEHGSPFKDLGITFPGPGGRMITTQGSLRLWSGDKIKKMIYVGYTMGEMGVDSHMIFAFPPDDSLVPAFTLDSVFMTAQFATITSGKPATDDTYAFHLDLVPRVDLGINFDYIKRAYKPLEATQEKTERAEGIEPAIISATQRAIMSPWMLANRSAPKAYQESVFPAVDVYLDHWIELVRDGLESLRPAIKGVASADRANANRALIFNPEIDPVWAKMDRMMGPENCARVREILLNPEIESSF